MKHLTHYLGVDYQAKTTTKPEPSLGFVVVIPCFNEPDLSRTIHSLLACKSPSCAVEVMVVVNYSEQANEQVRGQCLHNYDEALELARTQSTNQCRIVPLLLADMPAKHAGVGLSRKIGMDEAAHRFLLCGRPHGIIACFDADAVCDPNYFTAIEANFVQAPDTGAASIYYEHPLEGDGFPKEIIEGITQYELHLRYYNQAQRMARLPFAYHTVGSSMLCTASTYCKAGGMNKRKAGEDFYFLQKLIPHVPFAEINTTRVIPSPRLSDRVPFGTGRAMLNYVSGDSLEFVTYSMEGFEAIACLVSHIPKLYKSSDHEQEAVLRCLDHSLVAFLLANNFHSRVNEMNANSSSHQSFEKRFFTWFDAFAVLKYLNQSHGERWTRQPVVSQARKLLQYLNPENRALDNLITSKDLLLLYREVEQNQVPYAVEE